MDAYDVLHNLDLSQEIDEEYFEQLKKTFRLDYLNSRNYDERLARHRDPVYFKNQTLRELNDDLQQIYRRAEM